MPVSRSPIASRGAASDAPKPAIASRVPAIALPEPAIFPAPGRFALSWRTWGRKMHLAQLNIGHAIDRIDSPAMAAFAARIEEINALAEASPGFVWRHEGDDGYQGGGALWGPAYLVNLSVWESMEALCSFTYHSGHRELLAARRQWFQPMDPPFFVAWWVPAGHQPTLDEAKGRLDRLAAHGPGPEAFALREPYDAKGRPVTPAGPGA